jgi:hypothetical protein
VAVDVMQVLQAVVLYNPQRMLVRTRLGDSFVGEGKWGE